jgi:circadian clock protein KaiB
MKRRKPPPENLAPRNCAGDFQRALARAGSKTRYVLKLYVAGSSPLSTQAIENVDAVCRECLPGRYQLEVVDIHQQPATIAESQIVAAPTLVRIRPRPLRRLIGNLSNRERVLNGLNVAAKPA